MKQKIQIKHEEASKFWRALFTVLLLAFMMLQSFKSSKDHHLKPSECIWDWIFVKTDNLNRHFLASLEDRNIMMAITAYFMDFVTIYYIFIWLYQDIKTTRPFIAVALFYAVRGYIQNKVLFGRPDGFNFFDPGWMSATVPYHDISDFYFSGHVGVLFLYTFEYYSVGYKTMSYLTVFIAFLEGLMLVITRAHFIIDFTTAIAFSFVLHRLGELLSHLTEV